MAWSLLKTEVMSSKTIRCPPVFVEQAEQAIG